ncbi:MAG: ABC transporter ATP-binding protein [Bdellovibrionales bacterium]
MNTNAAPPQNNTQKEASEQTLTLLKRLIKTYVRPYIGPLAIAGFFMLIEALMTASVAQLMQPVLDDVISGRNTGLIIPVAAAFLGVFVLRGGSSYAAAVMMNKISQDVIGDVQKDVFRHLIRLDLGFFHANPSAKLMSVIVNDVNVLRATISDTLMGVGKSLLTLVFLVVVMFSKDLTLSLAAIVIFPFAALFVAYLGKRIRRVSKRLQGDVATLSDRLAKVFQGIRVVKAYGMERHEEARANDAITRVRKMNVKGIRIGALSTPVNETLVGLVLFGIIIYGGYQAAEGHMTAGQLGAFLTAFIMAYEPMKKLARLNNSIQAGLGAAERIFAMLDRTSNIKQASDAKTLSAKHADIQFEDVNFSYEGAEGAALNTISFTAKTGEVTALVGPSGGGKTTVMNMIPRFYDPNGGAITINGQRIADLTLESLRAHIAFVSQDITIFDDTIAGNIAYGKPDATQAQIESAARAAAAHDFIAAMADGYETQVGEDGVKLSGGQRQRISIARAILRDAPILLLDEATSALDNESEKAVQAALKTLEEGRTTLVIAHRLSTIQNAHQILVLEHGQIIERGNHDTLLAQNGLYAKMHRAGFDN